MLSMISAYQEPSRCVFEGVEYCNGEIVRGMSDWGLLQVSLRRVKCISISNIKRFAGMET